MSLDFQTIFSGDRPFKEMTTYEEYVDETSAKEGENKPRGLDDMDKARDSPKAQEEPEAAPSKWFFCYRVLVQVDRKNGQLTPVVHMLCKCTKLQKYYPAQANVKIYVNSFNDCILTGCKMSSRFSRHRE